MEYTDAMYQEDKKIAKTILWSNRSWFNTFASSEQDDCIQLCCIELWRIRERFDPKQAKWINFAMTVCKRVMWRFLLTRTPNRKNYIGFSLNTPLNDSDGESAKKEIIDYLEIEQDDDLPTKEYQHEFIHNAIKTLIPYHHSKIKPIIEMTLQGYDQIEISKIIDMNRASVTMWLQVFKEHCNNELTKLKELDEMEYTTEMHEQDLKLIDYIISTKFSHLKYMRNDLVQECLKKLWQARQKYDKELGKYSSYACQIITNTVLSTVRKSEIKQEWQNISLDKLTQNYNDYSKIFRVKPNNGLNIQYFKRLLLDFVKTFKQAQQKIYKIILLYLQGLTHGDIVKKLNISKQYCTKILQKMRSYLRGRLEQDNYFDSKFKYEKAA